MTVLKRKVVRKKVGKFGQLVDREAAERLGSERSPGASVGDLICVTSVC